MTSTSTLLRSLLIYSICLPLAIFLGYLLATPLDYSTFFGVGLVIFILVLPLLLRWHHFWLIATWGTGAVLFFLPGRPEVWLAMAWGSLTISFVQYILNRRQKFISVPSVTRPLLAIVAVVLVTAKLNGGIGLYALGSAVQGGKKYILIVSAIAGYFAFTSRQIHPSQAKLAIALFFLMPMTNAIGDLAHLGGGAFNFLFLIFPITHEGFAALIGGPSADAASGVTRLGLLSFASTGLFSYFLARYGIQEIFTLRRPLRFLLFFGMVTVGLFGGFRSTLITFIVTFSIVFYFEGLIQSRLTPVLVLAVALGGAILVGSIQRLPLSVQRTFAFLPIKIDPIARASAETSSDWRIQMWKKVIPDIPKYLLLGKGFAFNVAESQMVELEARQTGDSGTGSAMAGDFHNGPLSLLIPFGIFGALSFIWLLVAGFRVVYRNYQFGNPAYRIVNRFILAAYLCRVIFFFFIFGSLYTDIAIFLGYLGLSVSLNGGVARKPATVPQAAPSKIPLLRTLRNRPATA